MKGGGHSHRCRTRGEQVGWLGRHRGVGAVLAEQRVGRGVPYVGERTVILTRRQKEVSCRRVSELEPSACFEIAGDPLRRQAVESVLCLENLLRICWGRRKKNRHRKKQNRRLGRKKRQGSNG